MSYSQLNHTVLEIPACCKITISKLFHFYRYDLCNMFVNKVQLAFSKERETVPLCLHDNTTTTFNFIAANLYWVVSRLLERWAFLYKDDKKLEHLMVFLGMMGNLDGTAY